MPKKATPPPPVLQTSLTPQLSEEEESGYLKILQGNPTNELTRMAGKRNAVELNLNDRATIKEGALTVFIEQYSSLAGGLKPSTMKLLHAGVLQLTTLNHYGEQRPERIKNTVRFTLDEYMELRGLRDRKEARKQVKADLEALYNVSLEWTENDGRGDTVAFEMMRVFYYAKLERSGTIEMGFSPELAGYLVSSHVMYLPRLYWQLNDKHTPNSSSLLYKLALNQRINRGRNQACIISVSALLTVCSIPRYEELGAKGQVLQRIIDPFERDMHALEPTLTWEYCNKKGVALTEEQLADLSYREFSRRYVHYDLAENPERGRALFRPVDKG